MLKKHENPRPDQIELLLHRERPGVAEHGPDVSKGEPVIAHIEKSGEIVEPDAAGGNAAGCKIQTEVDEPESVESRKDSQGSTRVEIFDGNGAAPRRLFEEQPGNQEPAQNKKSQDTVNFGNVGNPQV